MSLPPALRRSSPCCRLLRARRSSLGERQQTLLGQQAVQASVALPTGSDEACDGECEEVPSIAPFLVNLANIELHCTTLFRWNQSVGRRALPRDVQVHDLSLIVLHRWLGRSLPRQHSTSSVGWLP